MGLVPPAVALWKRVVVRADGTGALKVIGHSMLGRSCRFPPQTFTEMVIEVQRITTTSRNAGEIDAGWRWRVRLVPSDPQTQRPLIFFPEWDSTLPPRPEWLTGRVRRLVRFVSAATGIDHAQVVKDGTPIGSVQTGAD